MKLKTVGGHTFSTDLLSNGIIIDIGCRDFAFAKEFKGKKVYCIDVDPKVFIDASNLLGDNDFYFYNVAISDKNGKEYYYENGEGTCLKDIDQDKAHPFKECISITMDDLYKVTGNNVDLLKLDCEGAEYIILGENFKPIPKQITVEFHYHCFPELHNSNYNNIIDRLSQHYTIVNDGNLMDTLFIRKHNIN